MRNHQMSQRKARTRTLIAAGGLLQKAGLLEAFSIQPGDDLQDYERRTKAAQLMGFLSACFQDASFDEDHLEEWQRLGERLLGER